MLEVGELAQLALDLLENRDWQWFQLRYESAVVDGAALVDHDLALFPISGDSRGQTNAQKILARKSGCAGKYPGRFVIGLVEETGKSLWGCESVLCGANGILEVERLSVLAAAGNAIAVAESIRKSAGGIYVNTDRMAIQAMSCSGVVIANIGINADFLSSIESGTEASPRR